MVDRKKGKVSLTVLVLLLAAFSVMVLFGSQNASASEYSSSTTTIFYDDFWYNPAYKGWELYGGWYWDSNNHWVYTYYHNNEWAEMDLNFSSAGISLSDYKNIVLKYAYWGSSEKGWDYLYVGYFDENGNYKKCRNYTSDHTQNGWETDSISLPSTAQGIFFVFYTDDPGTDGYGWYINWVKITGEQKTANIQLESPTNNNIQLESPTNNKVVKTLCPTMKWKGPDGDYKVVILDASNNDVVYKTPSWMDMSGNPKIFKMPEYILSNGYKYRWYVEYKNSNGDITTSGKATFSTFKLRGPDLKSPSNDAVISTTTPTLKCEDLKQSLGTSDPIRYTFMIATDSSMNNIIWSKSTDNPYIKVSSSVLSRGKTYYWAVGVIDKKSYEYGGGENWICRSDVWEFTISSNIQLESPTNNKVVKTLCPTMKWKGPDGDYKVVILDAHDNLEKYSSDWMYMDSSIKTYTIPNGVLTTGYKYRWYVEYKNSNGDITTSGKATFLTFKLRAPELKSPSNDAVISTTTPTLKCEDLQQSLGTSDPIDYVFIIATDPDIRDNLNNIVWENVSEKPYITVDQPLERGRTYYWAVEVADEYDYYAVHGGAYAYESDVWDFTTKGDNPDLTISIATPLDGDTVCGDSVLASAVVYSPVKIKKVTFSLINDSSGDTVYTFTDFNGVEDFPGDVDPPYSCYIDTTKYDDGNYIIQAEVVDVLGHTKDASISIQIDNTNSAKNLNIQYNKPQIQFLHGSEDDGYNCGLVLQNMGIGASYSIRNYQLFDYSKEWSQYNGNLKENVHLGLTFPRLYACVKVGAVGDNDEGSYMKIYFGDGSDVQDHEWGMYYYFMKKLINRDYSDLINKIDINIPAAIDLEATAQLNLSASGEFTYEFEKEIYDVIEPWDFGPIFGYVECEIEAGVDISITAQANLSAEVHGIFNKEGMFHATYKNGKWDYTWSGNPTTTNNLWWGIAYNGKLTVQVKPFIIPEIYVAVFGIAGPEIELGPELNGIATLKVDTSNQVTGDFSLYAGYKGEIGAKIDIPHIYEKEWEKEFENDKWIELYSAHKTFYGYWVDDSLPYGAETGEKNDHWRWVSTLQGYKKWVYNGAKAHKSDDVKGIHEHYFYGAQNTLYIPDGGYLVQWIYIPSTSVPREIMLQWHCTDGSGWNHRAYWGEDLIQRGTDGTASRYYVGDIPATGRWVELYVPAKKVGLEGKTIDGWRYTLYDGSVIWDSSGVTTDISDTQNPPYVIGGGDFSDNFNNGISDEWSIKRGTWEAENGVLDEKADAYGGAIVTGYKDDRDVVIEVDGKTASTDTPWQDFFICFGYADDNDIYVAGARDGGNAWVIAKESIKQTACNGGETIYAQKSETINSGQWYHLKVVIEGDTVTLYVDGNKTVSYTFSNGVPVGYIGLYGDDNHAQFDNFEIKYAASGGGNNGGNNGGGNNNGGPEVIVNDDFSSDSGKWTYYGDAYRDTSDGNVVLTKAKNGQVGVIWLKQEIKSDMTVEFDYYAGGGSGGADGFVMMFYKDKSYTPKGGGTLGFGNNVPGYGIEFDSYQNSFDPSKKHIALIENSYKNHLAYVDTSCTNDAKWHHVKVEIGNTTVKVYVDNKLMLSWSGTIDRTYGGFGFAGATGGLNDWHKIDNVKITVYNNGGNNGGGNNGGNNGGGDNNGGGNNGGNNGGGNNGGNNGGGDNNGSDVVKNGGFENGLNDWSVNEKGGDVKPIVEVISSAHHSGTHCLYIENKRGDKGTPRAAYIKQKVKLPDDAKYVSVYIKYWRDKWGPYMGVKILDTNGNVLKTLELRKPGQPTSSNGKWVQEKIDVSDYKGKTIVVEIYMEDLSTQYAGNSDHGGWMLIDDVCVITSGGSSNGYGASNYGNSGVNGKDHRSSSEGIVNKNMQLKKDPTNKPNENSGTLITGNISDRGHCGTQNVENGGVVFSGIVLDMALEYNNVVLV